MGNSKRATQEFKQLVHACRCVIDYILPIVLPRKRRYAMSKLYVGGLPYATSDEELNAHFAQAGSVVSATIIKDKMTGRSKGFGFVEMSSPEEAEKAISMFDGQDFGGRKLTVSMARPKEN